MIRHLIWDVDGTLFDTYPAIVGSLHAAAVDLGAPATYEETHDLALVEIDHCLATLSATYDLSLDMLGADFERRYQQVPPEDQPSLRRSRGGVPAHPLTGWAQPDRHPSPTCRAGPAC